jgi:glycosyltransferase involved in cell wall biosynthesis
MKPFQVSVTIPVYKAAEFVQQAVESALAQPQTAEVILVEDHSADNSWEVCKALAAKYDKVHLYRHPDGKNHGCSASRNLAVQKSSCEYIAFLDADDFYLPNRFTTAEQMFEADPKLEGVYEAVGMHVEDDVGRQRWLLAGKSVIPLETITEHVPPEELFSALVVGGKGHFVICGLVLKRNVFEKTGYFDSVLPLHMDEVLFIKLAALAKLMPGRLDEPVAEYRIHGRNRFSAPRPPSNVFRWKLIFWKTVWFWSREHVDTTRQREVLQGLLSHGMFGQRFNKPFPRWAKGFTKRYQLALLLFDCPALIGEIAYWQSFIPRPMDWYKQI